MAAVGSTHGKHGGSRRGAKPRASFRPGLLGLSLGVTLAVVAWGYLVYAAIDFGAQARGGQDNAWWFLGMAAVGAVACLFIGLMLIVWLLRALGITSGPVPGQPKAVPDPVPLVTQDPEHTGGHRAISDPRAGKAPKPSNAPGGKRAAR
ncbi:MAG: hypothetical protein JWM79_2679 [Nocardioides sp.]|nr:hypothetical protein [Nocardioides sp.]